MSKRGFFITFEGTDGTGKSTHAKRLRQWLTKQGASVVLTREPGGGRLAERIRAILLDPKLEMDGLTELFLYEAARCNHVAQVIRPALEAGRWVICDRFTDATFAYQGAARGLNIKHIEALNNLATGGIQPHLTLWLDLPPTSGLARAGGRRGGHDRLEKEGLGFQRKVRQGYANLARRFPRRIRRVPVQKSIDETQSNIRRLVKPYL